MCLYIGEDLTKLKVADMDIPVVKYLREPYHPGENNKSPRSPYQDFVYQLGIVYTIDKNDWEGTIMRWREDFDTLYYGFHSYPTNIDIRIPTWAGPAETAIPYAATIPTGAEYITYGRDGFGNLTLLSNKIKVLGASQPRIIA